ncbi:MAG: hypothetical protein M1812_005173 [Candelaria pacifica]|nr:MAG: hypothetical protein M1812_005173 [Candelaria pacifica]
MRSSTCPASDQSPEPTVPTSPVYPKGRVPGENYHSLENEETVRPPHHWESDIERKAFLNDYNVNIPALLADGWEHCFSPATLSYLKDLEDEEDIQTEVEVEEAELFCTCFGIDNGSCMVECANAEDGCVMRWFHTACLSKEARKRGVGRQGTDPRTSLHVSGNEQHVKTFRTVLADAGWSLDIWFCDRCIERKIGLVSEGKQQTTITKATITKATKCRKNEDNSSLQIAKRRKSSIAKIQDNEECSQQTSRKDSKEIKKRAPPPPNLKHTRTLHPRIEIPKASPFEFSLTASLQPPFIYNPTTSPSTSPESYKPLRDLTMSRRAATTSLFPQSTPSTLQPVTPLSRSRAWVAHEEALLIGVMKELSAQQISGASLWETASSRMEQHGILRSPAAAKAVWSRELRERSGIDERKCGSGGPMRTSLQKRKGDAVGRERERRQSA